ncbi:MAG: cupredoxin domain-containing protein [Xenococcus sp. MO_188.B8]|nr:cupredoxin domain-containing protein [Xenococcus sp. MO_188.B8]
MNLIFKQRDILLILGRLGKTCLITLFALLMVYFGGQIPTAIASEAPNIINISLGNPAGELKFVPEHLEFTTGQSYTLLLDNPSPSKHYFTAKDFADASWTKKVQVGKVEVKGAIHELELKPGGEAEWVLTPMKSGTYQFYCSIAGHKESGMTGDILVK